MTQIYNQKYLTSRRKSLRKNLTPAEVGLWKYLNRSQIQGRKFRRQHSIGDYIFDFYCPSEKLAIELDGEIHKYEHINKNDREKEKYLQHLGIRLLRFENKLVFEHLDIVLKRIEEKFTTTPSPDRSGETPPLKGGELIDEDNETLNLTIMGEEPKVK